MTNRSRRKFINYAMAAGIAIPALSVVPGLNCAHGGVFQRPKDLENLTELERIHLPKISLPPVVEDGAQASIVCSVDHPMDDDHYIKSIQKLHNPSLDIEGLLLTMYDLRLRLSNTVVEEVKKHFSKMVFKTIIQRNVRLGEAPSHGQPILLYDASSMGANDYMNLAMEFLKNNE